MENIGRGHAERLLPMIEELLGETGLTYDALTRIAVVTGPGTFTGLRIGLSVARGLALSLDIACVGLTSLMGLAGEGLRDGADLVHAVVKGRGGQLFYQAFTSGAGQVLPEAVAEPINVDADVATAYIAERPGLIAGSAAGLVQPEVENVAIKAVNPVILAGLAEALDADDYPPEPTYYRAADAVKAKAVFDVR